jgi:coiled-coil domain-containing protein 22
MKSTRKARCRQFVAEMKTFRTEMKEMAATIREKMEALHVLDKTYASLPPNINRNSYTNRIMDIIRQVHKQKQEIGRIIEDIKSIQKQLNFSSEKLKRSEAVTEEKLFGEASKQVSSSKDPNNPYVECYRKFAQVRELFEELILVVGDVGKKENAARDLENWITQLQGRDSSAQLDRVLADLQSVRQENATLGDQIRVLRLKQ